MRLICPHMLQLKCIVNRVKGGVDMWNKMVVFLLGATCVVCRRVIPFAFDKINSISYVAWAVSILCVDFLD